MQGLSNLPLGVYEKAICLSLSWEEKLLLARKSGYDFLEVVIDGEEPRINRLYEKDCAKNLCRAILNTEVPVLSMTLSANRKYPLGSEDESTRQKGIEIVQRAIDFAVTAGIRIIQLAPYCGGDEGQELLENLYASTKQCVAYAQQQCVMLSFEAVDTPIMKSNRQVMEMVHKIDSPFFKVYADIGNLNAMGVSSEEDLKACGRNIIGVHIKDSRPLVLRDVPLGEGTVDFDWCFRTLAEMEYGGILVAEMWCHENPEFHPYLTTASRFIRQAIATY